MHSHNFRFTEELLIANRSLGRLLILREKMAKVDQNPLGLTCLLDDSGVDCFGYGGNAYVSDIIRTNPNMFPISCF